MRRALPRAIWCAFAPLFVLLALQGAAEDVQLPAQAVVEKALPQGGSLSGREIFEKFLDNRMHSCVQWQTVISRDPSGQEQRMRFWIRWKDYRDEHKNAVDGVLAKTLVKFQEPEDMRQTGFLMVMNS